MLRSAVSDALLDRLCRETGLNRDDVAFLGGFDDAQVTAVIDACAHGRDKRERDLVEATEKGLGVVPFLLRPAVKKIIFS